MHLPQQQKLLFAFLWQQEDWTMCFKWLPCPEHSHYLQHCCCDTIFEEHLLAVYGLHVVTSIHLPEKKHTRKCRR